MSATSIFMSGSAPGPLVPGRQRPKTEFDMIGNSSLQVVLAACRHKLELKAITAISSVIATVAIYHQAAFMFKWYNTAEAAGVHSADPANATLVAFIRPNWFGGDSRGFLSSDIWWWTVLEYAFSGVNMFAIMILPWVVFNNWKFVRSSTAIALAACSILVNLAVGAVRHVSMGLGLGDDAPGVWALWTLALVWAAQVFAAASAPCLLAGPLKGYLTNPARLQLVYAVGSAGFSFFVLSLLAPAFAEATPLVQVILRVVVYTAVFEVAIAGIRVCTRINFAHTFPRDNVVALLSPLIIVSGLVGRILSTSMDTLGETIGVALALSAMEIFLRLTLPSRDRVLVRWCVRCCGCCMVAQGKHTGDGHDGASDALQEIAGRSSKDDLLPGDALLTASASPSSPHSSVLIPLPPASGASAEPGTAATKPPPSIKYDQRALQARAAREAQDIHAYFSLLTLDTMSEDIGILLSLPFALIMRLPPRVGGQPLGALDVLARVGGQYVLELLTDMAPALLMLCVNMCCGVQWRRVGGVSVRAAVLDQLSREAAEEGAGVEGAMSTPYVVSDGGDGGMVDDSEAVQAPVAVKKALGGGRSGNDVGSAEPRGAPAGAAVSLLAAGQVLDAGLAEGDIKTSACAGDSATGASGDPGGMTTSSTPSRPVLSSEAASTAASGMGGSMDSGGTCSMDVGGTGGDRDGAAAPAAGSGSRCDCVLRAGDADVQRHRAHLSRAYARSVRRVTGDAVWQPLEWRGMLRLAVSGSGVAGEAPAQVLWSDVTDVEGMSGVQLAVAYVSLSSELWAVRLGRAWETRFRGWNVLFFVGVFSAALLAGRNLAGPVSRCMLRDDEGVEYFDFCPEE